MQTDKFIGYWIICVQSYDYDGREISKGTMKYHTSIRPVISNRWRRATKEEVETKQNHKGNWFNLLNV